MLLCGHDALISFKVSLEPIRGASFGPAGMMPSKSTTFFPVSFERVLA